MTKEFILFEYGDWVEPNWSIEEVVGFEAFLEELWINRNYSGAIIEWEEVKEESVNQSLLQIRHFRNGADLRFRIKAANFVGIIRYKEYTFHILPKLFKRIGANLAAVRHSNVHLLWWLSYNRKLNLPKHVTSLSYQNCNFLEILIHLFSSYTENQLQRSPYQAYQEIESETTYLKGQLDFSPYVRDYLGRANYQKLFCRYDSFEIDNKLNRVIKFVCKSLKSQTQIPETRRRLENIINTLDEVADVSVTVAHCNEVVLNRMFGEYQIVLDYCKMFLQNLQTTSDESISEAFAFLVPMEKVFEEFVLGFMDREMKPKIKVTGQFQGRFLTTNKMFRLKPDFLIQNHLTGNHYIADTKYKLIYSNHRNVSQTDLYQMLAYAVRHRVDRVKMLYPKFGSSISSIPSELKIRDEFTEDREVKIKAIELEVVLSNEVILGSHISINQMFEGTRKELECQLAQVFE